MESNIKNLVRKEHDTLGIIKYPFWQMAAKNSQAVYGCVNYGEAMCLKEIERQCDSIQEECLEVFFYSLQIKNFVV